MQHATRLLKQEVVDERAVALHCLGPDPRFIGQQVRDREARAVLLASSGIQPSKTNFSFLSLPSSGSSRSPSRSPGM